MSKCEYFVSRVWNKSRYFCTLLRVLVVTPVALRDLVTYRVNDNNNNIIIFYRSRQCRSRRLKTEQVLPERLHFIVGGCVGEGTQDSDRIVALN